MLRINEYNIEPGVYRHASGELYVVTDIVTHGDDVDGTMNVLPEPLVIFRDLAMPQTHICYSKKLSDFKQKFLKHGKTDSEHQPD